MHFTNDWADHFRDTWARCPALQEFRPQRWLEIGTYEGRSACWMMQEKIAWGGQIVCVDRCGCFPEQEAVARANLEEASANNNVASLLLQGTLASVLARLSPDAWRMGPGDFDGCYIDGPKDYDGALETSRLAWDLVRDGGVLIWDDIHWDEEKRIHDRNKFSPVGLAVQTLLAEKGVAWYEVAWHGVQAVAIKPA